MILYYIYIYTHAHAAHTCTHVTTNWPRPYLVEHWTTTTVAAAAVHRWRSPLRVAVAARAAAFVCACVCWSVSACDRVYMFTCMCVCVFVCECVRVCTPRMARGNHYRYIARSTHNRYQYNNIIRVRRCRPRRLFFPFFPRTR